MLFSKKVTLSKGRMSGHLGHPLGYTPGQRAEGIVGSTLSVRAHRASLWCKTVEQVLDSGNRRASAALRREAYAGGTQT